MTEKQVEKMSGDVMRHTLPKKENRELAVELLARFPGVDHSEILHSVIMDAFFNMRYGNKREEQAACDFLNVVQQCALSIAQKQGLIHAK